MKVWIVAALLTYAAAKGDGPPPPGPNQQQLAIIHLAEAQRDALIAATCQSRSIEWLDVVGPAVTEMAFDIASMFPKQVGGEPYKSVATAYAFGAFQQANQDADAEVARYGVAACRALAASGALERLDGIYATAKKLPAK